MRRIQKAIIYYLLFPLWSRTLMCMVWPLPHSLLSPASYFHFTRAIYCPSPKWNCCLQRDITHTPEPCQVLFHGPLRCLKTAIHICARFPFRFFFFCNLKNIFTECHYGQHWELWLKLECGDLWITDWGKLSYLLRTWSFVAEDNACLR